jgi:hypothetical protein
MTPLAVLCPSTRTFYYAGLLRWLDIRASEHLADAPLYFKTNVSLNNSDHSSISRQADDQQRTDGCILRSP